MSQGESRLSRAIMAELRSPDTFCFKIHGGPTMMAGLPDIIGCHRGQFFGLETKMPDGGDPSAIQRRVHGHIRTAGGLVYVPHSVSEALEWFGGTFGHPNPIQGL